MSTSNSTESATEYHYKSIQNKLKFSLVPVNLHDEDEFQQLVEQRKKCGWNYETKTIEAWRNQIDREAKFMWWITIPATPVPVDADADADSDSDANSNTSVDSTTNTISITNDIKVGHIALSSETYPADPDLALADRSRLTVGCFFILHEYQGMGLGRACWTAVEDRAREIPWCRQITLDTIDRRYETDPSPEWGGFAKRHGATFEKGLVKEDWYARMGYQKFKVVPRYPIVGSDEMFKAVYLRKDIV